MDSVNSTSNKSNLLTGSKHYGGLVSGLDTDSLIEQLTSGTRIKIDKQQQYKQIAAWKQELYRSITTKVTDFNNKYFSYANSSNENILSDSFFETSSIKNTSSLLNISGDTDAAKNMVIRNIASLASNANFTTNKIASNQTISSTNAISDEWMINTAAGATITLNLGDKDYTLQLSKDFKFPSQNLDAPAKATEILNQLNNQISQNSELKDKIKFKLTNNIVSIENKTTDKLRIASGNTDLLSGLGLKATKEAPATVGGTDITKVTNSFLNNKLSIGSKIDFKFGSNTYTLSLPNTYDLSDKTNFDRNLQSVFTDAINKNADLKDKLSVKVENGSITFESKTADSFEITSGSQNLIKGLNLTQNSIGTSNGGAVDTTELFTSHLGDTLAGSSLTLTLNGINKTITFNESEKASFDNSTEIETYLQDKIDKAFGTGKISVDMNSGKLTMTTPDSTSVLSVSSSDNAYVLGTQGALHIETGETNRVELTKSLEDLVDKIPGLTAGANNQFKISVNGKEFSFDKTDTLGKVISTINSDSDAGVTIAYSSTTDKFSVTANDSGLQGKVDISDTSGNLATSLFGIKDTNYTIKNGTDAALDVSFDGGSTFNTITRTANNFALDGVNIELLEKSANATDEIKFTAESNIDGLYDKIKGYINDYNDIIKAVNDLTTQSKDKDKQYLPLTDAQKKEMSQDQIKAWEDKAKQGLLGNDSTLNNILTNLRSAMTDSVPSVDKALYQVGVSTEAYNYISNGKLVIDEKKLKEALTNDPKKVMNMFTGEDGISNRVKKVIDSNIGTFGGDGALISIAGKANSLVDQSMLTNQMKDYDKAIKDLKTKLIDEEDRYWTKFTAMEQALSKLNSQSSWLTQQFS